MQTNNYFILNNIKTPEDLLDYMNENIKYGWIDSNKERHIDTTKNFRDEYITQSGLDIIDSRVGTCIEQTQLEKEFFKSMNIPCKTYSLRDFRIREDKEDDVLMHCFLLYFMNDKCYHFEHSNPDMRNSGFEYPDETTALQNIMEYYKKRSGGYDRELDEFDIIPSGLTFKEVNSYLDMKRNKRR